MAIKAKEQISLSSIVDLKATYRYYTLTAHLPDLNLAPPKPNTYPPDNELWTDTEPTYVPGSNMDLYTVDCNVFSDDTFVYSEVSLSSTYAAAKDAYEKANEVDQKVVTIQQNTEDLSIEIQTIQNNGVDRVTTKTGYTFDEDGLHISKSDSVLETKIDNESFMVSKSGSPLLVADKRGLRANDINFSVAHVEDHIEVYDNNSWNSNTGVANGTDINPTNTVIHMNTGDIVIRNQVNSSSAAGEYIFGNNSLVFMVNSSGAKITGLTTPTGDSDAVPKSFVVSKNEFRVIRISVSGGSTYQAIVDIWDSLPEAIPFVVYTFGSAGPYTGVAFGNKTGAYGHFIYIDYGNTYIWSVQYFGGTVNVKTFA